MLQLLSRNCIATQLTPCSCRSHLSRAAASGRSPTRAAERPQAG